MASSNNDDGEHSELNEVTFYCKQSVSNDRKNIFSVECTARIVTVLRAYHLNAFFLLANVHGSVSRCVCVCVGDNFENSTEHLVILNFSHRMEKYCVRNEFS